MGRERSLLGAVGRGSRRRRRRRAGIIAKEDASPLKRVGVLKGFSGSTPRRGDLGAGPIADASTCGRNSGSQSGMKREEKGSR